MATDHPKHISENLARNGLEWNERHGIGHITNDMHQQDYDGDGY